jgi:hypothetical protein
MNADVRTYEFVGYLISLMNKTASPSRHVDSAFEVALQAREITWNWGATKLD